MDVKSPARSYIRASAIVGTSCRKGSEVWYCSWDSVTTHHRLDHFLRHHLHQASPEDGVDRLSGRKIDELNNIGSVDERSICEILVGEG